VTLSVEKYEVTISNILSCASLNKTVTSIKNCVQRAGLGEVAVLAFRLPGA